MSAVPSALDNAALSALQNAPDPYQGTGTEWPGATTTDRSGGPHDAGTPLRQSPPGPPAHDPLEQSGPVPGDELGGVVPTGVPWAANTGPAASPNHGAPAAPWDSSSGEAFAPSGPVSDLHDLGDGSDPVFSSVPADIGHPYSLRIANESRYETSDNFDPVTGQRVSFDADYTAHDFYSGGNGIDNTSEPIPYAVNPTYINVADTGQPIVNEGTPYSVSGNLPDRSAAWPDSSVAYEPPPDPNVTTQPVYESPSIDPGAWA